MQPKSSVPEAQATWSTLGETDAAVEVKDADRLETANRRVGFEDDDADPWGATRKSHSETELAVLVANKGAEEEACREVGFQQREVI